MDVNAFYSESGIVTTALLFAMDQGNVPMVKLLLANGADPNKSASVSPLYNAILEVLKKSHLLCACQDGCFSYFSTPTTMNGAQ